MIGSNVYLRLAVIDDVKKLFQWRNEISARENSFQSDIILYEEHQYWFEKALKDTNTRIYIMMVEDKAVGQVRLVIKKGYGIINYSIDPHYRCNGYGKKILRLFENKVLDLEIKLVGYVKKSNVASQRIFEQLGYLTEEGGECFKYTKVIKKDT